MRAVIVSLGRARRCGQGSSKPRRQGGIPHSFVGIRKPEAGLGVANPDSIRHHYGEALLSTKKCEPILVRTDRQPQLRPGKVGVEFHLSLVAFLELGTPSTHQNWLFVCHL